MRVLLLTMSVWLVGSSIPGRAHPHGDEPEFFEARGMLTKVDVANRVIEIDVVDNETKATRNLLLFVDPKVKIRNGNVRVELASLQRGQRVRCMVERRHPEGREDLLRAIVFEIRLDARS
jgi:hypothetical protein